MEQWLVPRPVPADQLSTPPAGIHMASRLLRDAKRPTPPRPAPGVAPNGRTMSSLSLPPANPKNWADKSPPTLPKAPSEPSTRGARVPNDEIVRLDRPASAPGVDGHTAPFLPAHHDPPAHRPAFTRRRHRAPRCRFTAPAGVFNRRRGVVGRDRLGLVRADPVQARSTCSTPTPNKRATPVATDRVGAKRRIKNNQGGIMNARTKTRNAEDEIREKIPFGPTRSVAGTQ